MFGDLDLRLKSGDDEKSTLIEWSRGRLARKAKIRVVCSDQNDDLPQKENHKRGDPGGVKLV